MPSFLSREDFSPFLPSSTRIELRLPTLLGALSRRFLWLFCHGLQRGYNLQCYFCTPKKKKKITKTNANGYVCTVKAVQQQHSFCTMNSKTKWMLPAYNWIHETTNNEKQRNSCARVLLLLFCPVHMRHVYMSYDPNNAENVYAHLGAHISYLMSHAHLPTYLSYSRTRVQGWLLLCGLPTEKGEKVTASGRKSTYTSRHTPLATLSDP